MLNFHGLALGVEHRQARQLLGAGAVGGRQPHPQRHLLVAAHHLQIVEAGEGHAQRRAHLLGAQAVAGQPLAVEPHGYFGAAGLPAHPHVGGAPDGPQRVGDAPGVPFHLVAVPAAHDELHRGRLAAAQDADGRDPHRGSRHPGGQLFHFGRQLHQALAALVAGHKGNAHLHGVGRRQAHQAVGVGPHVGKYPRHVGAAAQGRFELLRHPVGVGQAGAFGQLQHQRYFALVGGRNEFTPNQPQHRQGQRRAEQYHRHQVGGHPVAQAPGQHGPVAPAQPVVHFLEPAPKRRNDTRRMYVLQLAEARGDEGREGERDEQRKQSGGHHDQRKRPQQIAHQSGGQGQRHKHHHVHERHGHGREADGLPPLQGRRPPVQALFELVVDAFEHHNGVIDQNAHHQAQGQQREQVQREPAELHHHERAQQRGRNGHQHNQRGAQRVQKHEHDQRHQPHGQPQVVHHGIGRGQGKFGPVLRNLEAEARGRVLRFQGLQLGPDPGAHGHVVGPALLRDQQAHGGFAVVVVHVSRVLAALAERGHFRQPHLPALGRGAHHDLAQAGQVAAFAYHPHRKAGIGIVERTGGHVQVGGGQGGHHLGQRHAQLLQAAGIQVHGHLGFGLPHQRELAHARQLGQPRPDAVFEQVPQRQRRLPARGGHPQNRQVGQRVLRQAGRFRAGRQRGHHFVDAPLAFLQGQVRVGPGPELHRHHRYAFQALGRDALHAAGRRHSIFDGLGEAGFQLARRGPRPHRRDRHEGRGNVGQQLVAQLGVGKNPAQPQHQKQHDNQDGPLDGQLGKAHG